MASRLLDRLKRSLFKDGVATGPPEPDEKGGQEGGEDEVCKEHWEAELEEEDDECVTERLGGMLCFDGGGGGGMEDVEDGLDGEISGIDSDSDFLGESMEEGLSSTDTSPVGMSPVGPSSSSSSSKLTRQLHDSWQSSSFGERSLSSVGKQLADTLLFEVTDASVVQDGSSKYVLYTIHVIQSGSSDKTPAVITRRYSDFQRLHATLRRNHGDQMERVCFPRKKLRRNFTAETIAKRSRAFEQYLSHLCSVSELKAAPCVRQFFYMNDLQAGQVLIRVGRHQEALGPLLNAKRLQNKLGWACYYDDLAQASSSSSSSSSSAHWTFTLVGLSSCFQEVNMLEEARDHCELALHVLTETSETRSKRPRPRVDRPHPLLLHLLRVVVRLSWQTGRDKRLWEELLKQLEEQADAPDNQTTMREFLVKHNLLESEAES